MVGPSSIESSANKTAEDIDLSEYFAIGDPRFNMHPGHIVWTSIALYIHNTACDIIQTANPLLRDEDIFQRARVILFHIVQKIRLQDFVSDCVFHARDYLRVVYDPPTLRETIAKHFPFTGGKKPNFIEFNHVYQAWHSLIPDQIQFDHDENVPPRDLMWHPEILSEKSIKDFASAFTQTPIGAYGPHNFPHFVRGATLQALANGRAQKMAGYNDYRRYLGLAPLENFEQFAVNNAEKLADLYGNDIDQVEFLTGVIADSNAQLPDNLMGDVQLIIVALMALQDVSSSSVVQNPRLYDADYLTQEGLDFVKGFEFGDVLALLMEETEAVDDCPMHTPGSCQKKPSSYVDPAEISPKFMSQARVCSFIGANLTGRFFFNGGYGFAFATSLQVRLFAHSPCQLFLTHPAVQYGDRGVDLHCRRILFQSHDF